MVKSKKYLSKIILVFLLLEITCTILIQVTSGITNILVSFGSVVMACLFSTLFITKEKNSKLLPLGLFTTVCADIFLVVIEPRIEIVAMFFFSITQILYFFIIYNDQNKKNRILNIIIRLIALLIFWIACCAILKNKTDLLSLISVFYYINLLINIIFSFFVINKNIVFSIGLMLFAICDLFIGFSVMNGMYFSFDKGTLFYFLANPGFNLAWLFYVPSQSLIAICNVYNEWKRSS